jgi:hypothetical protein
VKRRLPSSKNGWNEGTGLGGQGETVWLTNRAVGAHPVGVAATEARVGEVRAMPTTLVRTLGPCQLTVEATPARAAEAFPIHTDAMAGAGGVQAVN